MMCEAEKDANLEAISRIIEGEHAWLKISHAAIVFGFLFCITLASLVTDAFDLLYTKIDHHILYCRQEKAMIADAIIHYQDKH